MAQRCGMGYYNDGDNREPCKPCPKGKTTARPGAGKSLADCKPDIGYGLSGLCPIGESLPWL